MVGNSGYACPACRAAVEGGTCAGCGRAYPTVAGLPDFRLESDRYLDLIAERAKAERLARIASGTDLEGVARAYYAITPDVDPPRCARYLAHILGAEARGAALADRLTDDGPILEVGCGTGGLLVASARRGLDIHGAVIAARWLGVARRRLDDHGLRVRLTVAQAERLPWPDASFATVVADSVIEHCDDPLAALREWRRVLRPGGRLIVWSPNRFAPVADPHVRLWGLGFLPRRWAEGYSRLRRGGAWVPRTLSSAGAARLGREAGFDAVEVGPPPIPRDWAATRPGRQKWAMLAHEGLRRFGPSRSLLSAFGPLWALEATISIPRRVRHADRLRSDGPSEDGPHGGPYGKANGDDRGHPVARNPPNVPLHRAGLVACLGAEVVAGGLGFVATVHLARRLGPGGFATVEVALATAGWLLVLVRGGLDQVIVHQASRRPPLIGRLTALLIRLRLAWAMAGFAVLALIAAAGGASAGVVMASGLVLVTSALVADVGPRARNELPMLAGIAVLRAAGLVAFVVAAVAGPADFVRAAMGPGVAEGVVAVACAARAWRAGDGRRARWDARAARALSGRAMLAGLTRFGRVGLYTADAMALGWVAMSATSGAYAAARRVVFALVAVGVVVPTLLAPAVARARGRSAVSDEVGRGVGLLLGLFVPAALGLILTSGRVLPALFGDEYGRGAILLALVAARLPVLLTATWFGAALVAIGHEGAALTATLIAGLSAAVALPSAAVGRGARRNRDGGAGGGGGRGLRRAGRRIEAGRCRIRPVVDPLGASGRRVRRARRGSRVDGLGAAGDHVHGGRMRIRGGLGPGRLASSQPDISPAGRASPRVRWARPTGRGSRESFVLCLGASVFRISRKTEATSERGTGRRSLGGGRRDLEGVRGVRPGRMPCHSSPIPSPSTTPAPTSSASPRSRRRTGGRRPSGAWRAIGSMGGSAAVANSAPSTSAAARG